MKYADASFGLWLWLTSVVTPEMSIGIVGVPLNLVVACAGATYAAFAMSNEKIEPASRAFNVFFCCVFMGCVLTALVTGVIAYLLPKLQLTAGVQVGIGATVSYFARPILLSIGKKIESGEWFDWIPFLRKKGG